MHLEQDPLLGYPEIFRKSFAGIIGQGTPLFVAGGPVRDWLFGKKANDLDLAVGGNGVEVARYFAGRTGGAFVLLDDEEGVARVVTGGIAVDFAGFREGTTTIQADLRLRDFTINSMAIALSHEGGLAEPYELIDPLDGLTDLNQKIIRAPSLETFQNDPLRLLRAFRFAGAIGGTIEPRTEVWIRELIPLVTRPSPERIRYELDLIISQDHPDRTFAQLAEMGLLGALFPELRAGEGMDQPSSHHLDVFQHNLAALAAMVKILDGPADYFPNRSADLKEYLSQAGHRSWLKWAALFHDLGKPTTCAIRSDGRTTFYNHDRVGGGIFQQIGSRYRMSREAIRLVRLLIELHMWPFHLNNANQKIGITPKACLRLVKAAGDDLPGLFLLAMADSISAQGPNKPKEMEDNLALLYDHIDQVRREKVMPVLTGPPLVTGHDLKEFGLQPGPLFRTILEKIEQARVEDQIHDRAEALLWVEQFLTKS
ncbi:MAG: HDIG domain-containing protein [Proteobacteria bacterium]|nr:HDIG domain-containing protein [Pseudomonadota bacterium]MBU1688112.1 HDIG domain-containing protein [Pseudomonadota bacterium]